MVDVVDQQAMRHLPELKDIVCVFQTRPRKTICGLLSTPVGLVSPVYPHDVSVVSIPFLSHYIPVVSWIESVLYPDCIPTISIGISLYSPIFIEPLVAHSHGLRGSNLTLRPQAVHRLCPGVYGYLGRRVRFGWPMVAQSWGFSSSPMGVPP